MRGLYLGVALLLVCLRVGFAADNYGWDPASLDIGGQHVLTFRAGLGPLTPSERRAVLEFRLTEALTHTEYLIPVTMTYRAVPRGIAIHANGVFFVTVYGHDARACHSTVRQLSREWGSSIKRTFETVGPARQLRHGRASSP